MRRRLLVLLFVSLCAVVSAQTVTVNFTARDAMSQYVQLDSVVVSNLSQYWRETVCWPDTVLTVNATGLENHSGGGGFALSQNSPNPCAGVTDVLLATAEAGVVTMEITDMSGRKYGAGTFHKLALPCGSHRFRVTLPEAGIYVMTARQNSKSSTIKMSCTQGGGAAAITYQGEGPLLADDVKLTVVHPFDFFNTMEYVGYAHINDTAVVSQSIIQDHFTTEHITLQFIEIQYSLPTVITDTISNITPASAVGGGNVTADGLCPITAVGLCWSTSPNPTVNDDHIVAGAGLGAFTGTITGLTDTTTYYVRAYATNSVGTAYGNEVNFTTLPRFNCGVSTVVDIDGNVYNTLLLGTQCWMKENLRTTRYPDSTLIPYSATSSVPGAYWTYGPDTSVLYGCMYNWYAAMGNPTNEYLLPNIVQGICPTGWHVPSLSEYNQIESFVGSHSQYICINPGGNIGLAKAVAHTSGWISSSNTCAVGNDPSTNNATGFGAVPAGVFHGSTHYDYRGGAYLWTKDTNYNNEALYFRIYSGSASIDSFHRSKNDALPVRCVLD